MSRRRKSDDITPGAPEWLLTYSDCMTLLLTFFVLLITFASFRNQELEQLSSSFSQALPSVGLSLAGPKGAVWPRPDVTETERLTKGSETPTQDKSGSDNFMVERRPLDFRNLRVFTIPSDGFFLGRGVVITQEGRLILDRLADFLIAQRGRVVVRENGPGETPEAGLERAWAVVEYLSAREGLDKNMFSITASTMVRGRQRQGRMLEITLLERDIYE